jgi:hypothetical protein
LLVTSSAFVGVICVLLLLFHGRHQTTKGIWIAKAVAIEPFTVVLDLEPFTVVLDLEGTDGRERGQVKDLLADVSQLKLNVPQQ